MNLEIEKKEYVAPQMTVIDLKFETELLCDSGFCDDGIGEDGEATSYFD